MNNLANLQDKASAWFAASKLPSLKQEEQMLAAEIPQLLGNYWLHMGPAFLAADLRAQFVSLGANSNWCDLVCAEDKWAIAPDYADVVLLQHSFDFGVNPKAILKQAIISLRPGGQLLITGFNPGSALGVKKFFQNNVLSEANFIAPSIVKTWLAELNLRIIKVVFSAKHVFGDVYLIVAHKVNLAGKTQTVEKPNWLRQIAPQSAAAIKNNAQD